MLVLSRRIGQVIHIGDDITIEVVRIGPHRVRLGVTAPEAVTIWREELGQPGQEQAANDKRPTCQGTDAKAMTGK